MLDEYSWVDHAPGWLSGGDELFEDLLRRAVWRRREGWLSERGIPEPHLTVGFGAEMAARVINPANLPRALRDDPGVAEPRSRGPAALPGMLREVCDALSNRYGVGFDSVWINLHRDGRDGIAWHGDRGGRLLANPLLVTISLGSSRPILLRRKGTTRTARRLHPAQGDLVVMGGACQHNWEHSIPKTTKPVMPRMSVTIRHSR